MNKKKVFAAIAAAVLALGMFSGCGTEKVTDMSGEQVEKVTPTFMYFVSGSDADFDATGAMIDELKEEYDGKINFSVVNIDEDSEAAKNFPVQGQTPALIMLNTANDISAMEFKCSDKEILKADIETALANN